MFAATKGKVSVQTSIISVTVVELVVHHSPQTDGLTYSFFSPSAVEVKLLSGGLFKKKRKIKTND